MTFSADFDPALVVMDLIKQKVVEASTEGLGLPNGDAMCEQICAARPRSVPEEQSSGARYLSSDAGESLRHDLEAGHHCLEVRNHMKLLYCCSWAINDRNG